MQSCLNEMKTCRPEINHAYTCSDAMDDNLICRKWQPRKSWLHCPRPASTLGLQLLWQGFIFATMLVFSPAGADSRKVPEPGYGLGNGPNYSVMYPDRETPPQADKTTGQQLMESTELFEAGLEGDEDYRGPETDVSISHRDARKLDTGRNDGQPRSGCLTQPPLLSISPSDQGALAGTSVEYIISLTNQDETACAPSIFNLYYDAPSGWVQSLSASTLALEPGETGSATLSLASEENASYGNYSIVVNATDNSHPGHTATASARYSLTAECAPAPATLEISPATHRGAPGSRHTYTLSITNNDSSSCYPSTFDITITYLPVGWSGNLSPRILSLSPGVTSAATLSVTSADTAVAGNNQLQIAVSDASEPMHTNTTVARYVVGQSARPEKDQ